VENLRQCVSMAGIQVSQFVLNPLAAGEMVLSDSERAMGVAVVDLGGGTTNLAIYIDGDVWYTNVLNVGGGHVTSDIAQGLRLPVEVAEEVKLHHGYAVLEEIPEDESFNIVSFGSEQSRKVARRELTDIIEARVEEIFMLVHKEIKRSGYDGMLPAGLVLTGGGSLLPGIRKLATRVTGLPARIGKPEKMVGLTDQISTPAFAASVGLLQWAILMSESNQLASEHSGKTKKPLDVKADKIKSWFGKLLP